MMNRDCVFIKVSYSIFMIECYNIIRFIIILHGEKMKQVQIYEFLRDFSQAAMLPIMAYENGQCILNSESGTEIARALSFIGSSFLNTNAEMLTLDSLLVISSIHAGEHLSIVIGPLSLGVASNESYASALRQIGFYPTKTVLSCLTSYFNSMRGMSITRMQKCRNALSISLNGKSVDLPFQEARCNSLPDHMPETEEMTWGKFNTNFVREMQNMVKNGLVDQMEKFFQTESPAPYGQFASDSLRHYKNSMMVHIYIIRSAAHEGGLDEDLCIRLSEVYSQKCENSRSIEELRQISQTLRLDFCRRVRDLRRNQTGSATVNKAINFIHENRMEKLDATVIASSIGVTPSYLCSEFKKTTAKSIVDFIMEEKIETAKDLLIHSDHSLLEISTYLSFSSQNYFQTVFKKHMGITPNEYRIKNQ